MKKVIATITDADTAIFVGAKKVQISTKYHDAVTHQECSTCGARK